MAIHTSAQAAPEDRARLFSFLEAVCGLDNVCRRFYLGAVCASKSLF